MATETTFYFNTKAQANKFYIRARRSSILLKCLNPYVYEIFDFEHIKEEKKQDVLNTAKRIYSEIMK